MRYATWAIVAFVTALRLVAAHDVPLTGDEAYYWEWAKHLALGYADHPPMVAYLILPFVWSTANPLLIRLPFVICGVVATLAAASTAKRLTGDDRAGMITALAMTLTPMLSVGFVLATPDGPLMAGWACSLYWAVRAWQTRARVLSCVVRPLERTRDQEPGVLASSLVILPAAFSALPTCLLVMTENPPQFAPVRPDQSGFIVLAPNSSGIRVAPVRPARHG